LTPDNSDVTGVIRKGQGPSSGERARIVAQCMYFVTCFFVRWTPVNVVKYEEEKDDVGDGYVIYCVCLDFFIRIKSQLQTRMKASLTCRKERCLK
jgi:hypothetical protein